MSQKSKKSNNQFVLTINQFPIIKPKQSVWSTKNRLKTKTRGRIQLDSLFRLPLHFGDVLACVMVIMANLVAGIEDVMVGWAIHHALIQDRFSLLEKH